MTPFIRRHQTGIALTVSVVVTTGILLFYLQSPWPWDPMFYMESARFYNGSVDTLAVEHRSLRWGLLLPIAFFQNAFGFSEAAYYAIPFLAAALLAVAVFVLGLRALASPWWAAGAAVLATSNPILLERSSHPFPDVLATALFTLGIGVVLWTVARPHQSLWLMAFAGIVFGSAYSVREAVVLFAPVVLATLIITARPWKEVVTLGGFALSWVGLEFLMMNHWFGEPLARIDGILRRSTRTTPVTDPNEISQVARTTLLQGTFGRSISAIYNRWRSYGLELAYFIGAGGALLSTWVSAKNLSAVWRVITMWAVLGWIVYVLVGPWRNARGGFIFSLVEIRYWYYIIPPLAIGTMGLIQVLRRLVIRTRLGARFRRAVRVVSLTMAVVLCAAMIYQSDGPRHQLRSGHTHMHEFRGWISAHGDDYSAIAAAPQPASVADMFRNTTFGRPLWRGKLTTEITSLTDPKALLISWENNKTKSMRIDGTTHTLASLPRNWFPVFVAESGELAVLERSDDHSTTLIAAEESTQWTEVAGVSWRLSSWRFEDVGETPTRLLITFQGTRPNVSCLTEEGGVSVPAADAHFNDDNAPDSRSLTTTDAYCPPATNGDLEVTTSVLSPIANPVQSVQIVSRD